jgi:predicted HAD superfamily phosphohydrolase YqeG
MNYFEDEFRMDIFGRVQRLRANGICSCILFSVKLRCIESLAQKLGVAFVPKAFRPFPFGYPAASRKMSLHSQRSALSDSQVFADILEGCLGKLGTILVRSASLTYPWFIRIQCSLEREVLLRLNKQGSMA